MKRVVVLRYPASEFRLVRDQIEPVLATARLVRVTGVTMSHVSLMLIKRLQAIKRILSYFVLNYKLWLTNCFPSFPQYISLRNFGNFATFYEETNDKEKYELSFILDHAVQLVRRRLLKLQLGGSGR